MSHVNNRLAKSPKDISSSPLTTVCKLQYRIFIHLQFMTPTYVNSFDFPLDV